MNEIRQLSEEYLGYCKDESRTVGYAESISFPESESEVIGILSKLYETTTPVTVQGGRTGLAAGAVPYGGHIMNLSRMNRLLGMQKRNDRYYLRVEPGLVLSSLRKALSSKNIDTSAFDEASMSVYNEFLHDREYFFPTDPTETSACLGGIAACNASGARSYKYGPARAHITALRAVLCDGSTVSVKRGEQFCDGRKARLVTEQGIAYDLDIPTYEMPKAKNASGYYACDNMDFIDIFVGSDGTLGVMTELELELLPVPANVWGISCFFAEESQAVDFTIAVREHIPAEAIEFFDSNAIDILRRQKALGGTFAQLPDVAENMHNCIYVELGCETEADALAYVYQIGDLMAACGGCESDTWVARTPSDKERQQFFRHAIPESVNMLIDERKRKDPIITKLGADMSVPNEYLKDVVALYRRDLARTGLESASWGHIGNNHIHVNVLPRNAADFYAGKELFASWAAEISAMGGAVSAEHGVGKLKRDYLLTMYGPDHVGEMAKLKSQLDPHGVFGRGNLFAYKEVEA